MGGFAGTSVAFVVTATEERDICLVVLYVKPQFAAAVVTIN